MNIPARTYVLHKEKQSTLYYVSIKTHAVWGVGTVGVASPYPAEAFAAARATRAAQRGKVVRGGGGATRECGGAGDAAAENEWKPGAPPLAAVWVDANNVRVVQRRVCGVVFAQIRCVPFAFRLPKRGSFEHLVYYLFESTRLTFRRY